MGREAVRRAVEAPARKVTNRAELARCLEVYGMPRDFAESVARTYFTDGPSAALVEMYAGGWEVVRQWVDGDNGERVERIDVKRSLGRSDGEGEREETRA